MLLRFKWQVIAFIVIPGVILLSSADLNAQQKLRSAVIGSAGQAGSSSTHKLNGTFGQSVPVGTYLLSVNIIYSGFWRSAWMSMVTGVTEMPAYRNELFQNYPNPFNPVTTIEFTIKKTGMVELRIYNVLGQRIKTLVKEKKLPGKYKIVWDGKNDRGGKVASGMYFYQFKIDSYVSSKKMVLLR